MAAKRVKHVCKWSFIKSNIQRWNSIAVTVAVNGTALTFFHILLLTQTYFKCHCPKCPDQWFQGDTGMLETSFPLLFFWCIYVKSFSTVANKELVLFSISVWRPSPPFFIQAHRLSLIVFDLNLLFLFNTLFMYKIYYIKILQVNRRSIYIIMSTQLFQPDRPCYSLSFNFLIKKMQFCFYRAPKEDEILSKK